MKLLVFFVNPNVNLFFKSPLRDLTALEGRKVTVGSKFRGDIVTKMGGVAVALRPPELFQALSRGVADGSMTNVAVIQAFKLNEELHYYLDAPMGGAASFMFMNKAVFDRLPAKAQKAITDNTGEAASRSASAVSQTAEANFMKELLKDQRNRLVSFDAAATAKWRTAVEPLVVEWHNSFPRGKAVADAFDAELAKK
jgi:TRAP-type C4-dicarboxylate transport system substrate-binding protein